MKKKTLVTLENMNKYIRDNTFYKASNIVVIPGVYDKLREKNIRILYEDIGPSRNKGQDRLVNKGIIARPSKSVITMIKF